MPGARLSFEEREEVAPGIESGWSLTGIARRGWPSGVDGRAGGGAQRGLWPSPAVVAERATRRRACRPKRPWLAVDWAQGRAHEPLRLRRSQGDSRIGWAWSTQTGHWPVSHETIYRALSPQGRGGLRADDLCAAHGSVTPSPQRPEPQQVQGHRVDF